MPEKKHKSALVVEGGGMRGIFAAGVLHAFGTAGFDPFDLYIGVSAGACHLASHLAGQHDRDIAITLRYSLTSRFINPWRFIRGGHLVDLDWMWEQTIANYRLNLKNIDEKLRTGNKAYLIVATAVETGRALYLRPDEKTLEHYLKVSSSLPILYRKILAVNGEKATDGGLADALPVRAACRFGATEITVIRSRAAGYVKKSNPLARAVFARYFRRYPRLVEKFNRRASDYNESAAFIRLPPPGIRIAQIAPPADLAVGRTTVNEALLRSAYATGIAHGNSFLQACLPQGQFGKNIPFDRPDAI